MANEKGGLPVFNDSKAGHEYGLDMGHRGPGLPGMTWAEGNMFTNPTGFVPNCDIFHFNFTDTVWSNSSYDRLDLSRKEEDHVLKEIFLNDAVVRMQEIEQLTLPPYYTTIPNTAAFSRFEHIWGSVIFIRQMAQRLGIDPNESMRMQLRTLVSDIAHTTGSHLGDWLFQGVGGNEDQHDKELKTYLEAAGLNDILRKYGFDPDEIIFPDTVDWVEAPSPDLCVDRVDYGLREMNRWNDEVYLHSFSVEDFTLTPENMLAMTDQRRARIFAESYLLLSEEHWSEPTHKFIEELFLLRTKLFYAEGNTPRTRGFSLSDDIHPRDSMYVTDPVQLQAFTQPSLGGQTLDAIMKSVAQYRRQYVWPGRKNRINQYIDQFANESNYERIVAEGKFDPIDSQSFDTYLGEYPPTLPTGFAILTSEEAVASKSPQDFDFVQTPFKLRQIDPLVQTEQGFARLSELDPSYSQRLEQHREQAQSPHVARLTIPDPATNKLIREMIENVGASWEKRLRESRRMSAEELRSLLQEATEQTHYGSYPFMDHFSY